MTAPKREPQHPIDHIRPLPASVVGRGLSRMSPEEIAATWIGPATRFGIAAAAAAAEQSGGRS